MHPNISFTLLFTFLATKLPLVEAWRAASQGAGFTVFIW